MKVGFIFECGPEGADVQVCRHLVYKLDPTIEFLSSTLDNKKNLLEDCGAVAKVLLDECKKVDDYCRISALQAMTYAVVEGIVPREDVLDFYGSLFTGHETDIDSDFWGLLAILICDLYPEKLMNTIKTAYEESLIFPETIRYEEVEEALRDGKEKCLNRLKMDLKNSSLDDIHESMSWWACFKQEDEAPVRSVFDSFDMIDRTKKKSRKKKAKKREK